MLKLICGPSGSGKTSALIESIRQDISNGTRCFLLVPEQQAYISERDFPSVLPENAGLFFEVVNFSGLAEDVFREYGGVTFHSLNNGIKNLLMWDTLRTLSPLLKRYGKSAGNDTTLCTLMMQTVEELHINGIDSERLEQAANSLPTDGALSQKLSDLALIDAAFREKLEETFGGDPSDKLLRMSKLLQEHSYFAGCHLYIDSFTSFTAQEYNVLREIMKQAECVTVTLCTDDFRSTLPHFASIVETAKRLEKYAKEYLVPIEKIKLSAQKEQKTKALSILEQDIWRFDLMREDRRTVSREEAEPVRLLSCPNLYEEAEAAAMYILELVQSGMHYGDIVAVARDIEVYRGVLDAAFERYAIPYFLSESTDLSSKPLTRLILSALRAVSHHFQVQDIMTLVKTGLVGVCVSDAAMFEEYCETWHISGSRFTDDLWSMNPDGLTTERSARAEVILDAANRVRKAVMDPLLRLASELRGSAKAPDRCKAIFDYLCTLDIANQLSERAKGELSDGLRREAGETVRLYQFVTDTLTTMCKVLPNAEMSVDELIAALTLLFSETSLASVPNVHDCVIIGSASTLRVENVKATLLLGLCEGEFPRAISDDGLLTNNDKEQLEGLGIILDSRTSTRSSEELLYVYRALAKPSERLYLSTVSSQIDGSARTPSLAFNRVCYLLDKKAEAFDSSAVWDAMKCSHIETSEIVYKAPTVDRAVTLRLSQSRLRTFMLCPFSYYSTYTLKLREKKDSRPTYADDGTFLHYVFEHFLKASLTEDGRLTLPPKEEIESLANRIVNEYIMKVCPVSPERTEGRLLHLFARLRKMAVVMLYDIVGELLSSRFVPTKFEQSIGTGAPNSLPAVILELQNGSRVALSGKVDRIDMYRHGEKVYIRVVDYKSGTHKFTLDDVKTGMDIQLVLYLFALLASDPEHIVPGGAQYLYASNDKGKIAINRSGFLLSEPDIAEAADLTPDRSYTKKLIPQTSEEISELVQDMNHAVMHAAERILAGEAQKTPSEEACMFCPIKGYCDKAYRK